MLEQRWGLRSKRKGHCLPPICVPSLFSVFLLGTVFSGRTLALGFPLLCLIVPHSSFALRILTFACVRADHVLDPLVKSVCFYREHPSFLTYASSTFLWQQELSFILKNIFITSLSLTSVTQIRSNTCCSRDLSPLPIYSLTPSPLLKPFLHRVTQFSGLLNCVMKSLQAEMCCWMR